MSRTVVFNELWLLSERDARARHLTFNPEMNLLAGDNGMGKSRVVKHLVWALGCEPPKRAAGDFDSNTVAVVALTIGKTQRTFVRQNRARAAFDRDGRLILATASASRWNEYFAEEFDFPLKLQRHDDEGFGLAGPSYAMLPFYIDQDGGWGVKWTNFTDLTQFTNWQAAVFNSFSGVKPPAYVRDQLLRDEASYKLRLAKAQVRVQQTSYDRVVAMLPPESTVIDEALFAEQLKEIAVKAQSLKEEQGVVRADLLMLAQERQQRTAELNTALESERSLVEDLAYLADFADDQQLVCPTCSHVHTTSFHARQTLAVDAHEIHEAAVRLQSSLEKLKFKEAELQSRLSAVAEKLRNLNALINQKQNGRSAADVIAAKSRDTLERAYRATKNELAAQVDTLAAEKHAYEEALAKLTDKGREKRVKEFFGETFISVADALDVDKKEIGKKLKIGERPPAASGSYMPRAVLATHLSLLATHVEYGVGCKFPLVVDTPQQSGQDPASLGRMLDAILSSRGGGQRMVATESIPQGWVPPKGCKVETFTEKRNLLRESEFKASANAVGALVRAMRDTLAASDQPEGADEGEPAVPTDAEDNDDE
jgi:hypothetical protein